MSDLLELPEAIRPPEGESVKVTERRLTKRLTVPQCNKLRQQLRRMLDRDARVTLRRLDSIAGFMFCRSFIYNNGRTTLGVLCRLAPALNLDLSWLTSEQNFYKEFALLPNYETAKCYVLGKLADDIRESGRFTVTSTPDAPVITVVSQQGREFKVAFSSEDAPQYIELVFMDSGRPVEICRLSVCFEASGILQSVMMQVDRVFRVPVKTPDESEFLGGMVNPNVISKLIQT